MNSSIIGPQVVRFGPKSEKTFTPKNIAFEKDKNEMSLKQCVKRVQCHHIASTCQMLIAKVDGFRV